MLVVAYNFPPHGAIGTMRTLRTVRQLAREDWDVTVLTGDPRAFRPGTAVDEALLSKVPPGVRVIRAATFRGFDHAKGLVKRSVRPGGGSSRPPAAAAPSAGAPAGKSRGTFQRIIDAVDATLAIPDTESGWLVPAVARGYAASRQHPPDVVYSSAPPWTSQLVAAALVRLLGCRWVADFRDPWARAPWREDRSAFAMNAAARLERAVVRRADQILFVAEGNRSDFARHYGEALARKFTVIANGCDPLEFDALDRPAVAGNGPFVLLHAGSLYAGRTPMPLLRALAAGVRTGRIDPDRFRLRLLGTAALDGDLVTACDRLGIGQLVELAPRVPREQSLRAMMAASALLLLQPGHTVSIPGKLYEYLAAGRPVLAVAEESEIATIVRASGAGVSVPPADEDDILRALERVMGMAGRDFVAPARHFFDGTARAAEVTQVLTAVVRGDAGASRQPARPPAAKKAELL